MSGKVYLVGGGPGKPDLITVRGLNILKEADVVIYDYLVDRQLLEYTKEGAELVCCDRLAKKGRYSDGFSIHQEKITNLVIEKAKKDKKVIRLKNGDPSIFSRCSQELEALAKARIEFEIVPGVTAASATSCLTGIPLTDREYATDCVFVTGHEAPSKDESMLDWNAIAKNGTVVLYMAVENLADIVKKLVEAGKDKNTPVAMVQNASRLNQRVLRGTLKDIAVKAKDEKIKPPAIIIIGKVAKLEKNFNWLRRNKRVLFTGLSE
ncbi:MAG: uroporphyrinogen-III C-methyltransferase, partial [Candidatus Omnitrophica bacterium CG10_big_fil_rev_8_21_14_0_10_43_8]